MNQTACRSLKLNIERRTLTYGLAKCMYHNNNEPGMEKMLPLKSIPAIDNYHTATKHNVKTKESLIVFYTNATCVDHQCDNSIRRKIRTKMDHWLNAEVVTQLIGIVIAA